MFGKWNYLFMLGKWYDVISKHSQGTKILLIFFRKQRKSEPGKQSRRKNNNFANIHSQTQWLRIYGDEMKGNMNKRDILMVCKMILQYLNGISEEKWKQYEFFRRKNTKPSQLVSEFLELFMQQQTIILVRFGVFKIWSIILRFCTIFFLLPSIHEDIRVEK